MSTKTIDLPCHGMSFTILTDGEGGGEVRSDLTREVCPHCDTSTCFYDCDGSKAAFNDGSNPDETEDEIIGRARHNAAVDAIESMALAFVCACEQKGTPVEGDLKLALVESVETALEALGNYV